MATNLSGSLSEFGLAEVLSLLAMGGRTARTQITSPSAVGTVYMVDGQISSASADRGRAVLLRSVVAAVPVAPEDLARALAEADPVRTLVDGGLVDRDLAQHVAGEQCAEAIGEMLRWQEGHFDVQVAELDPGDIGVRIDTQGLTSSAEARNQQWQEVRSALPSTDSVLALAPDVTEQPVVDVADWAVLARVDGHRTLDDVLAATGASPLTAGRRLVDLLGRGLVHVRVGGGAAQQELTAQLLDAYENGAPTPDPEPAGAPDPADPFGPPAPAAPPAALAEPQPSLAPVIEQVPEVPAVPFDAGRVGIAEEPAAVLAEPAVEVSAPVADPSTWTPGRADPAVAFATGEPTGDEPMPGFADTPEPDRETPAPEPAAEAWSVEPADAHPVGAEGWAQDLDRAVQPPVQWQVAVEAPGDGSADLPTMGADAPEPVADMQPAAYLADPVASLDEAGAEFAWSPWAQEMGLGEAPRTASSPVQTEDAAPEQDDPGADDVAASPAPQAPIATGTVTDQAVSGPGGSETRAGAAPEDDPLAEGLLAQLMSSVRGM